MLKEWECWKCSFSHRLRCHLQVWVWWRGEAGASNRQCKCLPLLLWTASSVLKLWFSWLHSGSVIHSPEKQELRCLRNFNLVTSAFLVCQSQDYRLCWALGSGKDNSFTSLLNKQEQKTDGGRGQVIKREALLLKFSNTQASLCCLVVAMELWVAKWR